MYDGALHWHNGFFSPVAQVTFRNSFFLYKKGDKEFNYNSSNAPLFKRQRVPTPNRSRAQAAVSHNAHQQHLPCTVT